MRVRAATAYKEYAHIPSIAEKLTKAGLLQHKTIQDNANSIVKKNKIPVIHSVELDNGYYPKIETIQKLKRIKNITAPKNKSLQGKIVLNKRQIHNLFGGNEHSSVYKDNQYHEALEKIYENKLDKLKNKNFVKYTTHINPGVIVQEARNYAQTGGNLFRGLGDTEYNIMDLRDNNSKEHFINQFLTKHTNKRVTSKQWKALIRKVSNLK